MKAHARRLNVIRRKTKERSHALISLERIIDGMGDGVIVIDRDNVVQLVNSSAAASCGMRKEDMIGRKCHEIVHLRSDPCDALHVRCPLADVIERGQIVTAVHTHFDARGDERYVEITASPVRDAKGNVFAMVETCRDIMEKKVDDELVKLVKKLNETQQHLKRMTITDELTGIRNRRYIVERLEEEFQRAKRTGRPLSLIMLDIDHFKQINDTHGHLFGDIVLKVIAARIKSSLRKHDLLGRVGGEEFLILSPETSIEDAVVLAERIRSIIKSSDISDSVRSVSITLSAGVTMMTPKDMRADKIFSRADTALYRAKEEGRNRVMAL